MSAAELVGYGVGLGLLLVGVALLVAVLSRPGRGGVQVLSTRLDPPSIPPPARMLRPATPADQTAVIYVVEATDPGWSDATELVESYYERTGLGGGQR